MPDPRTEPTPSERRLRIGHHEIGDDRPTFVIAELSGNHGQRLETALELVDAAGAAGADAVKLQTYTADTLTIDSDAPPFLIGAGTPWEGRTLHELYEEACTPWEWYPQLADAAAAHGMELFSTPFDASAVTFLEQFDPPAYKVASFELVDLDLVADVASRGKPLLMSTGMATLDEIDRAVDAAIAAGAGGLALLRCNSAYPAPVAGMDLRTIADMRDRWPAVIGLSDHTLGLAAASAAVTLGARVIEKHFTLRRSEPGPDVAFSLEPAELAQLVTTIRDIEQSLGTVRYGASPDEQASLVFRRSLFVVEDVAAGDVLTARNVRSIRPGHGMEPRLLHQVLGRRAGRSIPRGTPLSWDLMEGDPPSTSP
jgi:pseudaminic acid synthase